VETSNHSPPSTLAPLSEPPRLPPNYVETIHSDVWPEALKQPTVKLFVLVEICGSRVRSWLLHRIGQPPSSSPPTNTKHGTIRRGDSIAGCGEETNPLPAPHAARFFLLFLLFCPSRTQSNRRQTVTSHHGSKINLPATTSTAKSPCSTKKIHKKRAPKGCTGGGERIGRSTDHELKGHQTQQHITRQQPMGLPCHPSAGTGTHSGFGCL